VARVYFILDEDDLNRSNTSSVTEKLQFDAPSHVTAKLNAVTGLRSSTHAAHQRRMERVRARRGDPAGTGANPVALDSSEDEDEDDDESAEDNDDAREENRMRNEFRNQMDSTGIRSAVRGVVALTATPAACGHDHSQAASQVVHQICEMEHPSNYVGYEFTAAPYAERTIKHEEVPDRKQIMAIQKTPIYRAVLTRYGWWDVENDKPMEPFYTRMDGAITVRKKDLDDIKEYGDKSSEQLWQMVEDAQKTAKRRGDKVLESDGVGIAMMLEAMSRKGANEEPERRALIVSNFTRTDAQKVFPARLVPGCLFPRPQLTRPL